MLRAMQNSGRTAEEALALHITPGDTPLVHGALAVNHMKCVHMLPDACTTRCLLSSLIFLSFKSSSSRRKVYSSLIGRYVASDFTTTYRTGATRSRISLFMRKYHCWDIAWSHVLPSLSKAA